MLVRCRQEDPEVLLERRNLVQSRSVSELAKISGLSDLPVPKHIERLLQGKKSNQQERPQSEMDSAPKGVKESFMSTLPKSLKSEVLVRARVEDEEVLRERRKLVQTVSVGELARVGSPADIPVPKTLGNIVHGRLGSKKDSRS